MTQGYEYDIFLSAASDTPVGDWVDNHFLKRLREQVANEIGKREIFWFREQRGGTRWDKNVWKALLSSRLMVAVFSPQYFQSEYCLMEYYTMTERERLCGLAGQKDPAKALIYPVLYSDGDLLPEEAKTRQHKDLTPWHYHLPCFEESLKCLDFCDAVRDIARELKELLKIIPDWSADWKIVDNNKKFEPPKQGLPKF